MKKFTRWLIENNFKIIREWDDFLNTMSFEKDNIIYLIDVDYKKPRYRGDSKYTGNTISFYNIYTTKGKYNNIPNICIATGRTQKELIEDLEKHI